MDEISLKKATDDHALEAVPDGERRNWLQLSWSTIGIVTTLVQLFVGALTSFVAGIEVAIKAGMIVTLVGSLLGWAVGHVAYKTGLSSTLLARDFGMGRLGSLIMALVFGFMIIGFIAMENALLYKGILFYFGIADSPTASVLIYGALTLLWMSLTAFGFNLITRISSWLLITFLAVLAYIIEHVVAGSGLSLAAVLSFGPQVPPEVQSALGATDDGGRLAFCINVLIGSAGALALVDADLGRYARSSKDIGVAALLGNVFMDIGMLAVGGAVLFAGMAELAAYYNSTAGLAAAGAPMAALNGPDSIAAAFIVFGGAIGTLLMFVAQSKAQVLNTYSASLSLTNIFDVSFGWRPGRLTFVILANVFALLMLWGSILDWFHGFITVLGILTTCFSVVIVLDYFLVKPRLSRAMVAASQGEKANWAGLITCALGFVLAHYLLNDLMKIECVTSMLVCVVVYPLLRFSWLGSRGRVVAVPGSA